MNAGPAIEAIDLVKKFDDNVAVDGVSFVVPQGSVLGLLGPNGAGKTTTTRMLTTLSVPTSGTGQVAGHDILKDPDGVRRSMGLTGQVATVDELLTARENLRLIGRLYGLPRDYIRSSTDELLERFALTEAADRIAKKYSGGMRRRLDLAVSLVATPPVLFLDEPTTGLDPRSRVELWEVLRELVRDGTTLVLTTQYLEEADQLADRIAIIDHGRVIAEGTPTELKASVGAGSLRVRVREPNQRGEAQRVLADVVTAPVLLESDPCVVSTHAADTDEVTRALQELARVGIDVSEFSYGQPSLDEVFLALTGHPAEDTVPEEDAA